MTVINKQKFLAELGKLLTFMYEEDRQRAIALYAKIFDDAPNEQDALQVLGSPTRQAVIVARAYNAKERKLQVEAQSRELEEDEEESPDTPDYVMAILELYDQIVPVQPVNEPLEDQVSLFDEPEDDPVPVIEAAPAVPVEPPIPAPEPVEPVELPPEPVVEAERAPESEAEPEPEPALVTEDAVDAFLESFTIEGDELIDRENEAEAESAAELAEAVPETEEADGDDEPEAEDEIEPDEDEADDYEDEDEYEDDFDEDEPKVVAKRQVRPLLLIPYLIVAIPVCAALITLLLVPTALSLGLAVGVIAAGAALMITAFSGFAVLADILLVVGAALVVLAVGLLLLWLFIWFIGGPIVGLIRGAVRLGGRWCTKEVAA